MGLPSLKNGNVSVKASREEAIELLDGKIRQVIEAVPEEVMGMSEQELESKFKSTLVDWNLRQQLWRKVNEYRVGGVTHMQTKDIYRGICSRENFYTWFMANPYKMAWLLIPPNSLQDMIDEACEFALKRLRNDILTLPADKDTARVIVKAAELLMNRSMGPMVHKIEAKTLNANVDLSGPKSKEDIEAEFQELQERLLAAKKQVVDVEASPEE